MTKRPYDPVANQKYYAANRELKLMKVRKYYELNKQLIKERRIRKMIAKLKIIK